MEAADLARLPRPGFMQKSWLLGLCYRALAGDADPAAAALTARRIEHVRVEQTELLKRVSELKGSHAIAEDKALQARREAAQAALDLRIFEERNPPLPKPRGLRKRKPTPEEAAVERQRAEAVELQSSLEREAQAQAARALAYSKELVQLEARRQQAQDTRAQLEAALRGEMASWVLGLAAAGEMGEAWDHLEEMRRLLRGELAVATLFSLLEVVQTGLDGLKYALAEMKPIFEQYKDPLPRILSALAALTAGTPASRLDLGLHTRDSFSQPGHFRLYQLTATLAGWQPDDDEADGDSLLPTLRALGLCLRDETAVKATLPEEDQTVIQADPVLMLLNANLLLRAGKAAEVLELLRLEPEHFVPRRRRETPPTLLETLAAQPVPAWPPALVPVVHTALAGHALLAAMAVKNAWPLADWLKESYGWPKDGFLWWVLATVKEDQALLRNLDGAEQGLFTVRPV